MPSLERQEVSRDLDCRLGFPGVVTERPPASRRRECHPGKTPISCLVEVSVEPQMIFDRTTKEIYKP